MSIEQATGAVVIYSRKPIRSLSCPACGATYSADTGDYSWYLPPSHTFTCEHDDEEVPCALVERVNVSGTDSKGRAYYGHAYVTLTDSATVADLAKEF